jgi:dephospho-CoA kinase
MKIIGLTGSIGMGKTTTAAMFRDLGVPIWDADGAVHRLYASGGAAVGPVSALFPASLREDGSLDRDVLAKLVLANPDLLRQLEGVVHPLVGEDRSNFLTTARTKLAPIAIIDVPLLFETGGNAYVDKVIVVTCDAALQKSRVMARPGMSEDKFHSILARQTPDAQKRARADFLIKTDTSLDDTRQQVAHVYDQLLALSSAPSIDQTRNRE